MMDDASENGRELSPGDGMPTAAEAAAIEGLRSKLLLTDRRLQDAVKEVEVLTQDRAVLQRALDLFMANGDLSSQSVKGGTVAEQSNDYINQSVGEMIRLWASKHGGIAEVNLMSHEFVSYGLWPTPRAAQRALHSRIARMAERHEAKKLGPSRYRMTRHGASADSGVHAEDELDSEAS